MGWKPFAMAVPIVVALAAGIVALGGRGGDPAFERDQRPFQVLTPRAIDELAATAPDPRGNQRSRGQARCRPGPSAPLHNPWDCSIRYRGGVRVRYRVTVNSDGTFVIHVPTGDVSGCCAPLGEPTASQ
jgi:hypothetical protein